MPQDQVTAPQGWQCPLCKTVHAPFVKACHCQHQQKPSVQPVVVPVTTPYVPPSRPHPAAPNWWDQHYPKWEPSNPWWGTWSVAPRTLQVGTEGAPVTSTGTPVNLAVDPTPFLPKVTGVYGAVTEMEFPETTVTGTSITRELP